LSVKAYPDRVCIYFDTELIARHKRSYSRHQDIEDPEHAKGLLTQRVRAREQRLMLRFLALSPDAQGYWEGLDQKRFNARQHVRKILALAEIYPLDELARAISGFSCWGRGHFMRDVPCEPRHPTYAVDENLPDHSPNDSQQRNYPAGHPDAVLRHLAYLDELFNNR
jgi:hypothetical protein